MVQVSPVMLVFYGHNDGPMCSKQLCHYRDAYQQFIDFHLQLIGVSEDSRQPHEEFTHKHNIPFLLLSDPAQKITRTYGCSSIVMKDKATRAIFLINTEKKILYQYIEPSYDSMRTADFLIKVLQQLRDNQLI